MIASVENFSFERGNKMKRTYDLKNEQDTIAHINEMALRANIPTDLEEVKEAVCDMYEYEKEPAPKDFYLFDSPKAMAKAYCEVKKLNFSESNWLSVLKNQDTFPINHCVPSFYRVAHSFEDFRPIFEKYERILNCAYMCMFFKEEVFVSEFPTIVKYEGLLKHADVGPAIEFKDGTKLFYLWGIEVPEWAGAKPEELNKDKVMRVKNADQRSVIQRKYGIARLREELGAKVIASDGEYELITLELANENNRKTTGPFLAMKGFTTGYDHVEGVGEPGLDETIDTIEKAHLFRDPRLRPGFKRVWGL